MTPSSFDDHQPLVRLAAHLFSRREAILTNWRTACEADPALSNISLLSREEFNNLLPLILEAFEQRLMGQSSQQQPGELAQAHGLHRWQKSHDLYRLIRELNHLTFILYEDVQLFSGYNPPSDAPALLEAQLQIAQLMSEVIESSLVKYHELERLAAASRMANLEKALDQLQQLAHQRGDLLRASSHDLRGSFGIVKSAVSILSLDELSETERTEYLAMLNRNLSQIQLMMEGLLDLSRLEAGEETLEIKALDASQLLNELVASAQPLAREKGLMLQADGPDSLVVQTDPVKFQRIVQNLLLNALKYTPSGIVSVSWSRENDYRWYVGVQDSGPGLPLNLTNVLASQLRPIIEPTSVMGLEEAQPHTRQSAFSSSIPSGAELAQKADATPSGEGVGLQVVKGLCDLLEASMEVETKAGRGTLFRIRLPIHHSQASGR